MASRAKKISAYAVGVLSAGNTYFLGNIAGVTKRIAALASNITFTPSGGIAATTVQAAVEELDTEKFDKAGGTISGNLGVGVTPAAWDGNIKALQVGPSSVFRAGSTTYTQATTVASNTRQVSGVDYYIVGGYASDYTQQAGYHIWRTAPSGTAGSAASFVSVMTLDTSGNLAVTGAGSFGNPVSVTGNVTAHLSSANNSTFRGFKFGVTSDGTDYGGVTMQVTTGEVRYTAGFSGWGGYHTWHANGAERMRLDPSGNLLVGATSGSHHTLKKDVSQGTDIAVVTSDAGGRSARFLAVAAEGWNTADAAIWVGKNSVTNRGINSGGTINASGADAAEYRKNNGLSIPKGQIVGYKSDGTLTLTWSEATMARVKSTDPHIVGGDTWGTEDQVGARPVEPKFTPPQYTGRAQPADLAPEPQAPAPFTLTAPVNPGDDAGAVAAAVYALALRDYTAAQQAHADSVSAHSRALTAWRAASAQHAQAMTAWTADQTAHTAAVQEAQETFDTVTLPAYRAALAAFEARLEAARQQVDRIAYCGIVPCNVTGATPGHYIVAAEGPNDTITGLSVTRPTEDQWPWVVGRCLRVLPDGRAEIDVMLS